MAFVLVASACLLEGAVRVRHKLKYGSWKPLLAFVEHEPTGLPIPVPHRVAGAIRIDSRGFRNPELEQPKPAGRLRLAFLGGSTTLCAEAGSAREVWPARVCQALREAYPAVEFDHVNAGVSGYTVASSARNLAHRVAPLRPDVLVVYHATNDISLDTRVLAREQGIYREDTARASWLARRSLAWELVEKNLATRWRMRQALATSGRLEFDAEQLARAFEQRLAALVREGQALAPLVVLPTFSHRVRREQGPAERLAACQSSLYYMPYMTPEGCLAAFEAYNAAIRRVARDSGAILVEGELGIPADDAHFMDSVHLVGPGLERMAERVTAALVGAPAFEALLAQRTGG